MIFSIASLMALIFQVKKETRNQKPETRNQKYL
jgi:hypothetical protein